MARGRERAACAWSPSQREDRGADFQLAGVVKACEATGPQNNGRHLLFLQRALSSWSSRGRSSQPKRSSAFCLTRNHHQCSRLSCSPYRRPPPTHTLAFRPALAPMAYASLAAQPTTSHCSRGERRLRLPLRLRWQLPWHTRRTPCRLWIFCKLTNGHGPWNRACRFRRGLCLWQLPGLYDRCARRIAPTGGFLGCLWRAGAPLSRRCCTRGEAPAPRRHVVERRGGFVGNAQIQAEEGRADEIERR